MPVGTVGPEGLELPQQLADAVVGPGRGVGDHHGDHERDDEDSDSADAVVGDHKQENEDGDSGDGVVLVGYF